MAVEHTWTTNGEEYSGQLTIAKAIRHKCLDCCAGSSLEVKLCPAVTCSLHPFRFGKDPSRKRVLSDEQRIAATERLKKAREQKTA